MSDDPDPRHDSAADARAARSSRTRADAVRNREKIIAAARGAFAHGEGDVTFDALARRAGVGVGTLYRNFASRQALVEAVYRSELDDLSRIANEALEHSPADVAFRQWIDRYAIFVATKHGMAEGLMQAVASGAVTAGETRERIRATVERFLIAGARDGSLRRDLDPDDVTVALLSTFIGIAGAHVDAGQRSRVLDLLVDAVRPR